jgi:Zn-dependent protease with chaperone function
MVIQSLELVLLGLHWRLLGFPQSASLPAALGVPSYLPILFDASLASAVLGVIAATLVAVRIYFGKSRLEMLQALPGAMLVENPIRLRETILDLAHRANTKIPKVCLVDSGTPLTFTARMRRKEVIALSVGILECFDSKEVEEFNSRFSTSTAVSPARACVLERAEGVLRIFDKHPSLESRIKLLCDLESY